MHRSTTRHLAAVQPPATADLGADGPLIGTNLLSGSAFTYDPWALYERGVLRDACMVLIGAIGSGKSSLVKTWLWRQLLFGVRCWVLDVKDEYGPFAAACDVTRVSVYPGGPLRLNPLDVKVAADNTGLTGVREQQLRLLDALAQARLRRMTTAEEDNALAVALDTAARHRDTGQVTLPRVVDQLLYPTVEMADAAAAATVDELRREARQVGLALRSLVDGALAGMFDAPTSAQLRLDDQAVVFDLSRLYQSPALGLLMTCMSQILHNRLLAESDRANTVVVLEEAWATLSDLGTARYFQALVKLSRKLGVASLFVLHRLSDLDAVGPDGSEQVKIARGLLSDCGTKVIYQQDDAERPAAQRLLHLSDVQAGMLRQLHQGCGLWLIGESGRAAVVQHLRSRFEVALSDTDEAMHALTAARRQPTGPEQP